MWLKIVQDLLLHGTMDAADSERVSKRTGSSAFFSPLRCSCRSLYACFWRPSCRGTRASCEEWAFCFWGWEPFSAIWRF